MAVVNTTRTFTNNEQITSTKLNQIMDESSFTSDAIVVNQGLQITAGGQMQIPNSGITTALIGDNQVTTAKIPDSAITTAKIANSTSTTTGVTAAKIADGAITTAKLAANLIVDSVPSNFPIKVVSATKTDTQTITSTTTSWTDITGLSITLTRAKASASGKIRIQAVIPSSSNNGNHGVAFRIVRGSTAIGIGNSDGNRLLATSNTGYAGAHSNISGVIDFVDTSPGSSATVTYKIQAKVYSAITGYINRSHYDDDTGDYSFRTISTMTLTELSP